MHLQRRSREFIFSVVQKLFLFENIRQFNSCICLLMKKKMKRIYCSSGMLGGFLNGQRHIIKTNADA